MPADLLEFFTDERNAGLIRGERRGVEMHNTSRCTEIQKRFPGLIAAIVHAHKVQGAAKRPPGKSPKRKIARKNGTS
jgi:hypothetical protein